MNKLYKFLIAGVLFSCSSHYSPEIEEVLKQAGDNRGELEKVLTHYGKNSADSLKLRAAEFLIVNMPGHYSYDGPDILSYYKEIDPVLVSRENPHVKKDSIEKIAQKYPGLNSKTIEDIRIVTAGFLIRNIEQSFEAWEKPRARHLNFRQFCEYLLPYKCTELQQMDAWRYTLSIRFGTDALRMPHNDETSASTYHLACMINAEIRRSVTPFSKYLFKQEFAGYDFLNASSIYKIPFGLCPDYVALGVSVLRSHGIPVVAEETPLWGRQDTGHSWYTILNNNGDNCISGYDISTNFGSVFFPTRDVPKVYRQTYAQNPFVTEYLKKTAYIHPSINLFKQDVTDEYIATTDVEIPVFKYRKKDSYAYIALFNGREWETVDVGTVKDGKAKFRKMGRNLLYLVLVYSGNEITPVSHPFILKRNGELNYIVPDTDTAKSIKIHRKYPTTLHVANMHNRMINGKIQAANSIDFKDSVTLYTITSPDYPAPVILPDSGEFRYWRYLPPKGAYGNIAELQFFKAGKDEKETGEIIGAPGRPGMDKDKAFDSDWFTFYDSHAYEPWVGMDFGTAVRIEKVSCIPCSDDNNIHAGDEYELRYWNRTRWESLGKKIADGNVLRYDNAPDNALFWLRNLSRGKQERIFTYENGKQVFW
ncbi:MAG: hypothetical protein LBH60_00770 [Prevotellaceae bacterium]|jgi:hypothetical protein|nr:hypothetical protein [Prevotellaceae bacterium]